MTDAETLVHMELAAKRPATQEECCALAARVSIDLHGVPKSNDEFLRAAIGGATGLFGPAFEAADDDQKEVWIEMYERALRVEAKRHNAN